MQLTGELSDEQLVGRCLDGDQRAFEQLVERYAPRIYDFCLRLLGSAEEAEDAVQDTFTAAFQRLDTYRGDAAFRTWLYRIAGNRVTDALRRSARRRHAVAYADAELANMDSAAVPVAWADTVAGELADPALTVERRLQAEHLWRSVARMPVKYRLPLLLHYREGLSYREVAQILDVPVRTVETRLYRARQTLRNLMTAPRRQPGTDVKEVDRR